MNKQIKIISVVFVLFINSCASNNKPQENGESNSNLDKALELTIEILEATEKLEQDIKRGDSLINKSTITMDSSLENIRINFGNAVNSMDKKLLDSLMSNDSTFKELYNQSVLKK